MRGAPLIFCEEEADLQKSESVCFNSFTYLSIYVIEAAALKLLSLKRPEPKCCLYVNHYKSTSV